PLAPAPALEELLLVDMPNLQPEDLRPLVGLLRLKAVTAGLGSDRKNAQARELLALPEVRGTLDWRADRRSARRCRGRPPRRRLGDLVVPQPPDLRPRASGHHAQ